MRFRIGEFDLEEGRFELLRAGSPVALQPKVLRLLLHLVRHRERAVSKRELMEAVWPRETVGESSLTTAVRQARRALGDSGGSQRAIRTVRGHGYRFVAPVEEDASGPGEAPTVGARDPFVGREPTLAALEEDLSEALEGRGRAVLLVGEAGIGKTRTAEELASRARARGAEVLYGRCLETEGAPAYWPWIQVVRALVREQSAETLERWLGGSARELAQLVPELRTQLGVFGEAPPLESAQARFRVFDALCSLVERASRVVPLVLVLDDLHCADEASLQLLQLLVRATPHAHVLVLGTQREVPAKRDPARAHLLAELARAPGTRTVALEGLAPAEIARFVGAITGRSPSAAWVERLHEKTGGSPFFLTQLVRLLQAEGLLAGPASEPRDVELPRGVREVVRRQLDGLSARSLATLELASVAGRDFSLAVLAAAGELGTEDALAAIDEAVEADVVVADLGRLAHYRFAHALVRDALYGELAPARRAALHRRIGAALEVVVAADPEPHLAALAHHFLEAAPTGVAEKAVAWSARAGDRAVAQLAYEEAVHHYDRALRALELARPDDRRRAELLVARGVAEMRAGEVQMRGEPSPEARETLRRAANLARRLGAPDLLARAALAFGGTVVGMRFGVLDPDLVRLLEEALAALGPEPGPLRARVMGRLATSLYWSDASGRREALSREAVSAARSLADDATLAYALQSRRAALWGPERLGERLACAEEIVGLALRAGQRELEIAGRQGVIADSLESGDVQRADTEAALYAALAEDLRVPQYRWWITSYRGMRALMDGRFADGERLGQDALALGQSARSEDATQALGAQLFALRREQGRLAELDALLRGFVERFPTVPGWRTGLALLCAELRRPAEALEHFEVAVAGLDALPRDQNWMPAMACLSETCAFLGDVRRAESLYELLLPYRDRLVLLGFANGCLGAVARHLGILAETRGLPEEAVRHLEAARELHARIGARPWLARTDYDLAGALARRGGPGDHDRAREAASNALASARELGALGLATRAEERLHALGDRGVRRAARKAGAR